MQSKYNKLLKITMRGYDEQEQEYDITYLQLSRKKIKFFGKPHNTSKNGSLYECGYREIKDFTVY